MSKLKYFAYGSNMSLKRLKERVPSATAIGTSVLFGHRLVFHKVSTKDGSGKCDVIEFKSDQVYGVLYEIDKAEKPTLDRLEGLGYGYDEKSVIIKLDSSVNESAFTYFATSIDSSLKPFTWYKRHVLEGAREAQLPAAYIDALEAIEADEDPDKQREANELAIYS